MKLLPRIARSFQGWLRPEVCVSLAWLVAAGGIEVAGRTYPHEMTDITAIGLLGVLVFATRRQHHLMPLGAITWLEIRVRRGVRKLRGLAIELGVDLREHPPFERSVPPLLKNSLLVLGFVAMLIAANHAAYPSQAREAISSVSYLVYLALYAVLLAVLVAGTLGLILMPIAVIHDAMVSGYTGRLRRPKGREFGWIAIFLAGILALGLTFPPWVPVAGLTALVVGCLGMLALPRNPGMTLLWRTKGADRLFSLDYRWIAGGNVVLIGLFVVIVVMLAAGDALFGAVSTARPMPITMTCGVVFGWAGCAGLAAFVYLVLKGVVIGWGLNPRSPRQPVLYVHGVDTAPLKRWVRGAFRDWTVRFPPAPTEATDVQIRIGERGFDADRPERWPLELCPADLSDHAILARVRARDIVQKRRILLRGLERLFKRAARRTFRQGEGFWIGLQHWYVMGLSRDTDEQEFDLEEGTLLTDIIGPPYHRVFPVVVRHYFAELMQTLELDLIFVEDGVGYRRLRRVMRVLFDLYDRDPRVDRAEDRHFLGIAGVSVMIHDVAMDRPFTSETYPEPDYEDVGRARILHVFRDRGGDEEPWMPPVDLEDIPLPAGFA